MKYKRITVNLPVDFAEILTERVAECGYPSDSAYFLGMFLFDIKFRRTHQLTPKLLSQPPHVRDAAYVEIGKAYLEGGSKSPGWFEHEIERIIESRTEKSKNPELPLE